MSTFRSKEIAPSLSTEDTLKILKLTKDLSGVELKLTIPDEGHSAAIKGLGFDPVESQPRQAYFFDTHDLALNNSGIVVRARRIQGGGGDTVVKLRPVDPATIDKELRRSDSLKIELDATPGSVVCSASFKGSCTAQDVREVAMGKASLPSLFSKEQRSFFKKHAPTGIEMDALLPLGPTFILRGKHQPKEFGSPITVEMWLFPDGSRTFEISTKCEPRVVFQVAAEFKAYLAKCGIEATVHQELKTKSALEFFSVEYQKRDPLR